MKRIFSIFIGFLLYVGLAILLTGYGNERVHPGFNEKMLSSFLQKKSSDLTLSNKFVNYDFAFDSRKLTGTGVVKAGNFYPHDDLALEYGFYEQGEMSLSPKDWIIHGGYSADLPGAHAGVRHFYNATWPKLQRYLTNTAEGIGSAYAQSHIPNPNINGVDWAISQDGHYYNWDKGKTWMKSAFETANISSRNEYMAKAWRSLGETLHMIADNGCPSHVRNDAHPPSKTVMMLFKLGDPDVYEEMVSHLRVNKPDVYNTFFGGLSNTELLTNLKTKTKIKDLAHDLALFTSNHFFTGETYTGTLKNGKKITHITNADYPYDLPTLSSMTQDGDYYLSQLGEVNVKQASVKSVFSKVSSYQAYPFMDEECVVSQAQALFPNIVEAGALAINLFIPKLEIQLKQSDNNTMEGTITHTTDEEYTDEILYNGLVSVLISGPNWSSKSLDVQATNGEFKIENRDLEDQSEVVAWIDCGGIKIESDEFKVSIEEEVNAYSFYIDPDPLIWETETEFSLTAKCRTEPESAYYYEWDFGDGSSAVTVSNDSTVSYTYTEGNDYFITAKLYVNNELKYEAVAKAYISENENPTIDPSITNRVFIELYCNMYNEGNEYDPYWSPRQIFTENYQSESAVDFPLSWSGRSFTTTYKYTSSDENQVGTISGRLSDDGRTISHLSINRVHTEENLLSDKKIWRLKLEAQDIPFDYDYNDGYDTGFVYEVDGKDLESSITQLKYRVSELYNYPRNGKDSVWTEVTDFNGDLMGLGFIPNLEVKFSKKNQTITIAGHN